MRRGRAVWAVWGCLAVLASACGDGTQAPTVGDVRIVAEPPEATGSAREAAPCGRADLTLPDDMPLDAQPAPSREMWLAESLSVADVVVWGRAAGDRWQVEEVLCGRAPASPPRFTLGADASEVAARFLVQTQRGYFDVGPLDAPATRAEWETLSERAQPREAIELEVEVTQWGVTRYAMIDGERTQYGTAAAAGDDYVAVTLADGRDEPLANRVFFQGERLLAWERHPARGRGFFMRWWDDGTVRDYEHFLDGRPHGVSRTFHGNGRVESEIFFRSDQRHGPSREYAEDGTLLEERVFENGLIPPVTRPRTEPTEARIFPFGRLVSYDAPPSLVDRITVGMGVQQVADLLGVPVSAELGVSFPGDPCLRPGVHVHFEGGRVSRLESTPPLGACAGL